ncbi:MAG: amino acid ABC transporter ATP-binding protein [Methylobacteriaceae bacterium]|nr:amino acid ABC transporter ATP-binding protein [Methylobacteriaceae bacterium]
MLRTSDVHKRFGRTEVLKGVSLDIPRGEVLGIIGSSGSGKTTFLRCINLLEEYEVGTIELDGQAIGYRMIAGRRKRLRESEISDQRAEIGMVFQSFNLFPHMTVEQNIMLGLTKVRRMPSAAARTLAGAWLDRVGLTDKRDLYPYQLSGGQQQRVAIARAVAMEPKLMLLDEVTSALDPELVGEVLNVIRGLAHSGMTMLVVSHEMHFVRDIATRVVFMEGGRIAEEGPPGEILMRPRSARLVSFLNRFHGTGSQPAG